MANELNWSRKKIKFLDKSIYFRLAFEFQIEYFKLLTEIFGVFECLLNQNLTNQDSRISWFFQIIWKTVGSRELLLSWKLFQNLLYSKFSKKKSQVFSACKPTEDMKFRPEIFHITLYIWTQYNIRLFWELNKNTLPLHFVEKILKNQPKRLKNWILQLVELYIS